MFRSQQIIIRE